MDPASMQNNSDQSIQTEPAANAPIEQPAPLQLQETLPQQEMHDAPKKSGFLSFLITLLVLIGFFTLGCWIYQSYFTKKEDNLAQVNPTATIDPTTNWTTYTNDYWGISFKYPETDLKVCPNYTTELEGVRLWGVNFGCVEGHDLFYKIGLVGYMPGKYVEPKKPFSSGATTIDGKPAIKKVYVYGSQDGPLSSLNQSVEIDMALPQGTLVLQQLGNSAVDQMLFEQILATFLFAEKKEYNVINLSYTRPNDWSLWGNSTDTFSFAFDASIYNDPTGSESNLAMNSVKCCQSVFLKLIPYNGESLESLLFKNTGYVNNSVSYEKDYKISDKEAMFLYNTDISGNCSAGVIIENSKQARLITSQLCKHSDLEPILSTIKID